MNADTYYEILSNRSKYWNIYNSSLGSEDELNNYENILPYYFSLDEVAVQDIEKKVTDSENDFSADLIQELLYVKRYRILTKKYSNLFQPLKYKRNNQIQKDVNKISRDEDVLELLKSGEALFKSSQKLLYVGISYALLLDRLNRENESIEIINEIEHWYPENRVISRSLKKLLQNIYFRNKMHKSYKLSLIQEQDKALLYLYKSIKFYQFNTDLFIGVNTFVFLAFFGLWIILGKYFIFMMIFIILFNVVNIIMSVKKENLLMLSAFFGKTLFFIFMFALYILLYFIFT